MPSTNGGFCALTASVGARAYYDTLRDRGTGHRAALRELGNRLVASSTAASRPDSTTTRTPPGRKSTKPLDDTKTWA